MSENIAELARTTSPICAMASFLLSTRNELQDIETTFTIQKICFTLSLDKSFYKHRLAISLTSFLHEQQVSISLEAEICDMEAQNM